MGSTSIRGDFHRINDLGNGFWNAGGSVLYTDDDDAEYKWVELDFMVGSDTFQPGMICEVGLKGLLGDAEKNGFSGDVGAVAFDGRIGYDFTNQMLPIQFEVFAGLTYANEIMSFRDTEEYLAFRFGIGVPIFEYASVIVEYSTYDMDMASGPGRWTLDDDALRLGLQFRF